jgi:Ca-activated chloride channel family protein
MKAELPGSGRTKLAVAKDVLSDLVTQVPEEVNGALWIYGHRYPQEPKETSCRDIEQVFPLGPVDGEAYIQAIRGINAKGYTPIADSLTQSADSFPTGEDQSNSVILVSDGKETCGGDPCALAAALKKSGAAVTIHVVGYAVDEETREQLQCIADASGGTYRDASSADLLREALEGALDLAQSDTTLRLEVMGPKKQHVDARLTLYERGTDRMVSGMNSWWDNLVSPGTYDVWVETTPPVFYSQLELPKGSNTVIRLSAGSFEFLGVSGEPVVPYQVNVNDPASGDQLGCLLDPGGEPYYVIPGSYDLSLYPDISSNDPQAVFRTTIEPLKHAALQMGAFDLHGVGGQKLRPSTVEFRDAASDTVVARFTQSEPDLYDLAPGTYRVGYTMSWTCSSWSGWLEDVVVQPGETTVATLGAYVLHDDGQTVAYAHTLIDASSGEEVGYYCGQVDQFFAPPGTYNLRGTFTDFSAEDVKIKAGEQTGVKPQ